MNALRPPGEARRRADEIGRPCSATHRSAWASSSSSMLAKCWLATMVFVSGQELDARLRKGHRHRAQQRTQTLLELCLGLRVGLHMTRPGLQPARAKPAQVLPAQLTADLTSEAFAQPGGHSPSAPPVALGMRSGQGSSKLQELWGR